MTRHTIALVAFILAIAGFVSAASAQTGPNPVPVGTPVAPPPGSPPQKLGPMLGGAIDYPFDFHFHDQIFGYGFQPQEHVTITLQNVSGRPTAVTVDGSGSFTVTVDFTWVFCGPSASTKLAPVVYAAGNLGSTAALAFDQPSCPYLAAREHMVPGPEPGTGGSGGAVSSGTAVVGTALPGGTIASPPLVSGTPVSPPPLATPRPWPTPIPYLTTFDVQGFGFVAGEQVTLYEKNSPAGEPSPVSTVTDAEGRIQTSIQAYVPFPCGRQVTEPEVVAAGNMGTSASAPLRWIMPLELACPVFEGPTGAPGSSPPADIPPAARPPGPSAVGPTTAATSSLSIRLQSAAASPGGVEQVNLRATPGSIAHLTVRYPHKGQMHRTIHIGTSGSAQVRWRIPRATRRGTAHVTVTFSPGHVVLKAVFTVR